MDFVFLLISLLGAWLSYAASKAIYGDGLAPMSIFCGLWFMVFALYFAKLYPYPDLSLGTWAQFGGALIVFALANILVTSLWQRRKNRAPQELSPVRLKKAVLFCWILGLVGFVIQFVRVVSRYGLSVFIDAPEIVHQDFAIRFIGYLYLFNGFAPVLAFLYMKKFHRNKTLMSLVIATSLITLLFSVSRTNTMRAFVMMYFALVFAGVYRTKIRHVAVLGTLVVAFFVSYHFYKNPLLAESLAKDRGFEAPALVILAPTYGYLTTPFTIYEVRSESLKEYEWGKNTFNTLYRFARIINPDIELRAEGVESSYECNPVCANVFTYLDVYYRDFGIPGVFVLVFLQGLLVAYFYCAMKWDGKKELFLVNAVFGWCLLITFFSNHFAKNSTIFFLIVSYIIGRYVYTKRVAKRTKVFQSSTHQPSENSSVTRQ